MTLSADLATTDPELARLGRKLSIDVMSLPDSSGRTQSFDIAGEGGRMEVVLDRLARYAHPIVLVVSGLLAVGAALTVLRLPLIGWPLYGLGYLGLLVALPALGAFYRAVTDRIMWVTLGLLYLGVLVGVPIMLTVWGHYVADPTVPDAVMAHAVTPLGMLAGAAWIGLALFGLAAFQTDALPRGGALLLVVAAVIVLAAELGLLGVFSWAFGILLVSVGLVWVAPQGDVPAAANTG